VLALVETLVIIPKREMTGGITPSADMPVYDPGFFEKWFDGYIVAGPNYVWRTVGISQKMIEFLNSNALVLSIRPYHCIQNLTLWNFVFRAPGVIERF
jgi:hypothetical protein